MKRAEKKRGSTIRTILVYWITATIAYRVLVRGTLIATPPSPSTASLGLFLHPVNTSHLYTIPLGTDISVYQVVSHSHPSCAELPAYLEGGQTANAKFRAGLTASTRILCMVGSGRRRPARYQYHVTSFPITPTPSPPWHNTVIPKLMVEKADEKGRSRSRRAGLFSRDTF